MGINVYRDLLLEANYCLLVAVVMEIEGEDVSEERGIAEMEIINKYTTTMDKLDSFNHWRAYIMLALGHKEQFLAYCDSCNFSAEEVNHIIKQTV